MKGKRLNLSQNSVERLQSALMSFSTKNQCTQSNLKLCLEEHDIAVCRCISTIHSVMEEDQLIIKSGRTYHWRVSPKWATPESRRSYTEELLCELAEKGLIKDDDINPYDQANFAVVNSFLKNGGSKQRFAPKHSPISATPKVKKNTLSSNTIEELVSELEARGFEVSLKHIIK